MSDIPSVVLGAEPTHREKKMKQFLKVTVAPATALFALAFVAMATPASAGDYCMTNTSGMGGGGYSTMERCQAGVAGVFGNCSRDPFLPAENAAKNGASNGTPSNALAYQPKHARSHRAKTPVVNQ